MRKKDSDAYHSTSGDGSASSRSDSQGSATSDSTYGSSHIVIETSADILVGNVNQSDFTLDTANAIQQMNPNVSPERLVALASIFKSVFQAKSSQEIYLQVAHALKVQPNLTVENTQKLIELMSAIKSYDAKVLPSAIYLFAAQSVNANPQLDVNKFIKLLDVLEHNIPKGGDGQIKFNVAEILKQDANVNPQQLVNLTLNWRDSFMGAMKQMDEMGINSQDQKNLVGKFNNTVMMDSVRALKDKPNVDPVKIVEMMEVFAPVSLNAEAAASVLNKYNDIDVQKSLKMMELFKEYKLDIGAVAKILDNDPNLKLNKMKEVVEKFESNFLDIRDNLPIELFPQAADITDRFYDEIFLVVAEKMKASPSKSAGAILEDLGVQQQTKDALPSVPAQVRSWSSSSQKTAEKIESSQDVENDDANSHRAHKL